MEKIVIRDRLTGGIIAEYSAEETYIARTKATERKRKTDKITDRQFDDLVASVLKGTRGGKRLNAARMVLTQHMSCSEAARMVKLTPASVTQLVIQLEKAIAKIHEERKDAMFGKAVIPDLSKPIVDVAFLNDRPNPLAFVSPPPVKKIRLTHQEFTRLLELAGPEHKVRGSTEGARLMLVQGALMSEVKTSFPDISTERVRALVEEIKALKQSEEDAAEAEINDLFE